MPPMLEPHGSISTVDLSVVEHAPRQEAPPPCNGRGTLGSPLTARPGMYSPRHSLAPYPAAHSALRRRICRFWHLPRTCQGQNLRLSPGHISKIEPPAKVAQCGVLYIGGFRVKLGLYLLLLSFSSHITDLLLGNLGNSLRSQARVGSAPAKVTLAGLAGLGRKAPEAQRTMEASTIWALREVPRRRRTADSTAKGLRHTATRRARQRREEATPTTSVGTRRQP